MSYFYVYVLKSAKDGNNYVGFTKDLKKRLKEHEKGLVLIYFEGCLNQQDATHREKYLKTHHGKMFLGDRLKSYLTG